MKIVLKESGILPTRAHATDAGLDLYAPYGFKIGAHQRRKIDTGVCVELPADTVGYIRSKSGMMARDGILTDGTIDEGYTGEIGVVLFNLSDQARYFQRGDKIAQLVVQPVLYPGVEVVESLAESERGACGFGSTGK